MAEIFDQAEDDGLMHFNKLPPWIEHVLYKLIS